MRAGRLWLLVALMGLLGAGVLAAAPPALVVTGEVTLTPANIPSNGFASIYVKPGGRLIILTSGTTPLEIPVRDSFRVAGEVDVLDVPGPSSSPTGEGGRVFINMPQGWFRVDGTGLVQAGAVPGHGQTGGVFIVVARKAAVLGGIRADGCPDGSSGRGGFIEINTNECIEVGNPSVQSNHRLATLSATGYYGGVIRLLAARGPVVQDETSLLDVRGVYGRPFDADNVANNASLLDIEGKGVELGGFRCYAVQHTTEPGRAYIWSSGLVEVTPINSSLAQAFADQFGCADVGPLPWGVGAEMKIQARTHRGNVVTRTNLAVPIIIDAANNLELLDGQFKAAVTATAGGFARLCGDTFYGPVQLKASRTIVSSVRMSYAPRITETRAAVCFTGDTFDANEVYCTPCPLKLVSATIGAGARIEAEGSLEMVSTRVADCAVLRSGVPFPLTFKTKLSTPTRLLAMTSVRLGNGVCIEADRLPYYASSAHPGAKITSATFGARGKLAVNGSLEMVSTTVGPQFQAIVNGGLKFTSCRFNTGTIEYTGAKSVTNTQDGQITYIAH